jgi:hypothetical protein
MAEGWTGSCYVERLIQGPAKPTSGVPPCRLEGVAYGERARSPDPRNSQPPAQCYPLPNVGSSGLAERPGIPT